MECCEPPTLLGHAYDVIERDLRLLLCMSPVLAPKRTGPLGHTVCKTAMPPQRLFHLVLESHTGRALVPIPKRSASPWATSTPQRWIV